MRKVPCLIAATVTGMFIGYLIHYFLFRLDSFTFKSLLSLLSAISGRFLINPLAKEHDDAHWYYLIAVPAGFFGWAIIATKIVDKCEGILCVF